jgi:hypothetical protein
VINKIMSAKELQQFSGGEVYFWIEADSSIMLKAVTSYGDPVELGAEQVREIAEGLLKAAAELEKI